MSTAIIFGANGQDGHYLRNKLLARGITVKAVSRSAGDWIRGDVGDREFVQQLISQHRPEHIFHLAANSSVNHELLWEHQHTIVKGTLNILESAYEYSPLSRIFITGSGLQFINTGAPIKTSDPFQAGDCYSLARIQSVFAARYYREKGMTVRVGYLFHHDSPFRKAKHLNRIILDAALAAQKGEKPVLEIADITVEKEFGFAGDIAEGIWQLINNDDVLEACIGTGKAWPISKWLELCFASAGLDWKDHVKTNPHYQPAFKKLVADPGDMHRIGWTPQVGIEDLCEMMMNSGS